jgi:hypothetical protein
MNTHVGVADKTIPLGADTATSWPIALSGMGAARERRERMAAAPIRGAKKTILNEIKIA